MKIINKKLLAKVQDTCGERSQTTKITRIDIEAPLIAAKAKPGQFVVLMAKEEGERIPLTIVDADRKKGIVTLIFQELGFTTKLLGSLSVSEALYSIVGPLGHPTEIKKYGKAILVGGGVGIAEIYPVAKALKAAGNHVTTILGARTKDLLVLEAELKSVSGEILITTDDGSYGKKGFTTDILKEILSKDKYDFVYTVGPIPMMRKVCEVTKSYKVKTAACLNALMVDGTGMCGCCRVTVDKQVKFSCIDGPEFDGHLVDWEELEKRSKIYCKQEDHICKLNK